MQVSLPAGPCSRACSRRASACTRWACCCRRAPACASRRRSWAPCFCRAPRYARASSLRAQRHRGARGQCFWGGERAFGVCTRGLCFRGAHKGTAVFGCAQRDCGFWVHAKGRRFLGARKGMAVLGLYPRGVQGWGTILGGLEGAALLGCARRGHAFGEHKRGWGFWGVHGATALLGCAGRGLAFGLGVKQACFWGMHLEGRAPRPCRQVPRFGDTQGHRAPAAC